MAHLASILVLACLIAGCCCVPLTWEDVGVTGLARSRWFAGSAFVNGRLFIFGGQGNPLGGNDTGILGDTWSIDIVSGGDLEWVEQSAASAPSPRYGFVGGVVDNYWIVSHGCGADSCFSDTWAIDLSQADPEWFQIINPANHSGPIPQARLTTAGGVFAGSDQLWMSMGENLSGRKLSDTWILQINNTDDSISGTWSEVAAGGGLDQYHPFLPSARSLHTGAPINATTFAIFGGCASGGQVGGPCPLQDNWVLDSEGAKWERFPLCVTPAVRSNMIMVPTRPGQAFVMQGSRNYSPGVFPQLIVPVNETDGGEVYIMNTGDNVGNLTNWKRVQVGGAYPVRREGAFLAMDVAGGVVYLVGGRTIADSTFQIDVWRLLGDGDTDEDEGCPAPQLSFVHLHGMFMYVAWGLLLPLGALLGRYYRWTWPCWFVLHILCQCGGVLFTVAGFVIIFLVGSFSSPDFPHAIVGIVLTFLLLQQFLSGIFHPCVDKENGKTPSNEKSAYRKCWEVYHGASGFISIAIGLGQLMLGVLLIGAPTEVWCVWAGLGGLWVLTFLLHEIVYICYNLAHKVRRKRIY